MHAVLEVVLQEKMSLKLHLIVIAILASILVTEAVAPRRRSESDLPGAQKEIDWLQSKSERFIRNRFDPRESSDWGSFNRRERSQSGNSPVFRQREGKQKVTSWEIEEEPQPVRRKSPPKMTLSRKEPTLAPVLSKPVTVLPQPAIWNGMTYIDIQGSMEQIKSMKYKDLCLTERNSSNARKRCKNMVSALDYLHPDSRTEACKYIKDGSCRKTGTDEQGKDIHQCTCYPYTTVKSFRCISRPRADKSRMLLFKDCVNPYYP